MTRFFLQENIPVPEIYETDLSKNLYLQQDLGDQTLFSILTQDMDSPKSYSTRKQYLQTAVKELARIQIVAGKKLDFNVCYPYKTFSQSAILYDLNYFRKQFLDRIHLPYNKGKLRKDFRKLSEFIDTADKEYFMFRDFQSRNIMVSNEKLYFIDYQGGRKGPLQYDLASLLFQARARIPEKLRTEILEYYIKIARMLTALSREEFLAYYYSIALIRVLQTLGAYGLRGLKEKKAHFIQSIPFALDNLHPLSKKNKLLEDLPELKNTIEKLKNINISEYGSIS
jgi:aminoglycoside/choline kinase family phosphotransferase